MTKLLDEAIKQVRELSDSDQDLAADILFSIAAKRAGPDELDHETIAAINEGLAQIERGEVVSEEEMAEFFRQRGI